MGRDGDAPERKNRSAEDPLALAANLLAALLRQQGIRVAGRAVNADTSEPLADISIYLETTGRRETRTDASGAFSFDEVPAPPNQMRWDPIPIPPEPLDFVDGLVTPGAHQVSWDGRSKSGQQLPNGVYFCRIESRGAIQTRSIVLLFAEVLGEERQVIGDQMARASEMLGPYYNDVFFRLLPEISAGLRKHPEDLGLLVDGVVLYHIIIEGAMAMAGQASMLQLYKQMEIFPGYQIGFTSVARDESRHVLFGVKFLYDMVQADNKYAYRIVDFINGLLQGLYDFGRPAPEFMPMRLKTGQDIDWTPKFYASALRRKLRAMGIHANIPDPKPTPIPPEVLAMVAAAQN